MCSRTIVCACMAVCFPLLLAAASRAETAPEICAAIASAFGKLDGSYPKNITSAKSYDELNLDHWVPGTAAALGLSAGEFEDLKQNARKQTDKGFEPSCHWRGKPVEIKEPEIMWSSFSRPVLSSDGQLALFSWSLETFGRWGHGDVCLARRTGAGWAATCIPGWIS